MAVTNLEEGFRGISIEDANEWAALSLPAGLAPPEEQRLHDQLTKMALFCTGGLSHIRFAQEVLDQYLLGQWFARLFTLRPSSARLRTFQIRWGVHAQPWDYESDRVILRGPLRP